MDKEQLYKGPKDSSAALKSFFRNQNIFSAKLIVQSDMKASFLMSISFSLLLGLLIILLRFDTYLHFPVMILMLPITTCLMCILSTLNVVRPEIRIMRKLYNDQIKAKYPDNWHINAMNLDNRSLEDREQDFDKMVNSHSDQIADIVRQQYLTIKYGGRKYRALDRAYTLFLATLGILLALFIYNAVASDGNFHEHHDREESTLGYDFDEATAEFILDKKLEEVSGLSYDNEKDIIYTHNDEKGRIYRLSPYTGEIVSSHKFGDRDDYESIELVEDKVFLATSAGDLHITDDDGEEVSIQRTKLPKGSDLEGMAYNPRNGKLLFALKGNPITDIAGEKAVYTYDPHFHRIDSSAYLDIRIVDMQSYVDTTYTEANMRRGLRNRLRDFAPSGIAVHPITKDIYVLTARGSIIAVFDHDNNVKDVIHLNEVSLPQPEGICFAPNGDLYVSSEGHGGRGKLYMYEYQNQTDE